MKRTIVTRDNAPPLLCDMRLRLGNGTPRTFRCWSADGYAIWNGRGPTMKAENRGAITVLRAIWITIFKLTMAAGVYIEHGTIEVRRENEIELLT